MSGPDPTKPSAAPDLDELFEQFGDIFGPAFARPGRGTRGGDLRQELILTLDEALLGAKRVVVYARERRCERCAGKGTITDAPCLRCEGRGTRSQKERVTVTIPEGVKEGSVLRLPGRGNEAPGGEPGHLYLPVTILQDPRLRRRGDDLIAEMVIDPDLAELGGPLEVPALTGSVTVQVPASSEEGSEIRRRGGGLPKATEPATAEAAVGNERSPYRDAEKAFPYGDLVIKLLIRSEGRAGSSGGAGSSVPPILWGGLLLALLASAWVLLR